MANIVLYTSDFCPFCVRAKRVLDEHGLAYEEINLSEEPQLRAPLVQRTGMLTVPQIFIDDQLVGGSDELVALAALGGLPDSD